VCTGVDSAVRRAISLLTLLLLAAGQVAALRCTMGLAGAVVTEAASTVPVGSPDHDASHSGHGVAHGFPLDDAVEASDEGHGAGHHGAAPIDCGVLMSCGVIASPSLVTLPADPRALPEASEPARVQVFESIALDVLIPPPRRI